jgi:hypothetical protein
LASQGLFVAGAIIFIAERGKELSRNRAAAVLRIVGSAAMVKRYAHQTSAHLASHVEAFGSRVNLGSNGATN